jgi:hypothetical protein
LTVGVEGNANRLFNSSETSQVQEAIKPIAELYFSEQGSGKAVEGQLLKMLIAVFRYIPRKELENFVPWHSRHALYQVDT